MYTRVSMGNDFTCTSVRAAILNYLKRHRTFLYEFFCQNEDIFWHFIGLISETPDLKGIRDRTKRRIVCIF